VCCEVACDASCQSCSNELTSLPNGRCAPTVFGIDPQMECSGGVCRGDGDCCGDRPVAPGGGCPAVCNGGCDSGVCHVVCGSFEACRDQTIDCPPGFACDIDCSGERGCQKSAINCPDDYPCSVTCADVTQSCRDLRLFCGSGVCELQCNGEDRCDNANIECGRNSCHANCSGTQNNFAIDESDSCDVVDNCVST
jgi:hypothetical protein